MAFLIDIGTGIVGKLVDLTIAPIGRQMGYLIYYNWNIKKLENQLNDLVVAGQCVEHKVGEEKKNMREVEAHVNKWLTDVQKITGEANEILNEEPKEKMKCLYGLCPNLVLRHQLSRKSTKLVLDIAELYGKKDFSTFAHATTPQDVPTKDYEAFGSRILVVNQIMDLLRNCPNLNMIGVYGLGGVGKTTLVKEVSRQATKDKTLFDDVVMILDVKQNPSIERIQKEIAEKLELDLPDETIAGRARRLYSRIKDQKTLVILDDVWERIDLEVVGLSCVETCKVLLTSRTREVLSGKMHTQKEFVLDRLKGQESWNLFEKMAGDVIKDPAIKKVATKVAKRCGGLPVLVVTVASALKIRRTVHEWKDALRRLEKFDKEEFTKKTYLALEWSYNQLDNEELKPLFLLCGFYADSSKTIYILDLFKYGFGLGLFKNLNTMGEAWDALNSLLEKLKDSCLLLDYEKSGFVRMHDLVHDVAKRILSRDQNVLIERSGDELKEWPDNKDFCEKCTMIFLEVSNIPKHPEVLQCAELKLFILSATVDRSLEIPCNFFQEMAKLSVLDLTGLSLPSLPPSLKFLKSLKTLCLEWCTLEDIALIGQLQNLEMLSFAGSRFKELPKEIGQLTHLRSLDLTGCFQLKLISPNVISSLTRLEELKMGNSFNRWEAKGVISTEKKNASLSELRHLSKLSALEIHILDANILPTGLFSKALKRYRIYIGAVWNWDDEDANLNTLKIKLTTSNELYQSGVNMLLKTTDELHLNGMEAGNNTAYQLYFDGFEQLKHLHVHSAEFIHIIKKEGVFPNLKRLVVSDRHGLRFLLSSSMARSLVQLTHLQVSGCQTMEEIVSTDESDEKLMNDMFSKLQHLELKDLPILTRFCSRRYIAFPSSEILQLENYNEVEERDSRENLRNALFDEKVVFPSLKRLLISGLTKLMTIWHNQLSPESFKNLETVDIRSCQSLKSIFPSSMVRRLQQLMHLNVVNCGLEEILENEDGLQTTHEFVFSKVNSLRFEDLPHLRSGMHASRWPSLEILRVLSCCKVAFLAQECSSFERNCEPTNPTPTNNQALFLMKKDSFPDLKRVHMRDMEIWDGPFPVELFSKLEFLEVGNQHSKSAVLEKFLDLEKPSVTSFAHSNEISFHEKSRTGDINALEALPYLTELWLSGMSKLMHLGEDNTQSAGQNFPNLKVLGIKSCDSLRNLRSSAISFNNLTVLVVINCPGLEYLINSSTCKSFMQLTRLIVEDCARLVEIVGSTEVDDDSGNEIVFSQLKYLRLSKLPRLQGFCSGDCIIKFPSLETLFMSKRLKLKIFHNDERVSSLQITREKVDTDVDADDGETVTKEKVDRDTGVGGEQIDETTKITNKNEDANVDGSEHVQPLETTATDQGDITPVQENLAIIPVGEVTTPVFPVIESTPVAEVPHTEEVREQAFSGQNLEPLVEAKPDVHQTPNAREQPVEEQSDPLEPSAAATGTPTPTIPALPPPSSPKSSGTKRSLREKLQALSANKAASSSGQPEEAKAKLKALIATADLKDPHTRQQLLAVLPTLQLSTTKWIADLAVQELSKLPLVRDKEESLCQELAALKAQGSELDVRSHKLLSEGPLAEENIQKVQEQKVGLLALVEQIKKLEARATSIQAEIALGEKRYSGFEASLDQLVKEQKLNQLSVDSTSEELLRTRAVSDSLSTAILTYLRQLL